MCSANVRKFDRVITVERLTTQTEWVYKYLIKETGKVFYDASTDIDKAYRNFCLLAKEMQFKKATVVRGPQFLSNHPSQLWVYVYYLDQDRLFLSAHRNIHKAYVGYLLRTNRKYRWMARIRAGLTRRREEE